MMLPCFTLPLILCVTLTLDATAGGQETSESPPLQLVGTIKESDVTESSGLAISRTTDNAFWTHNDSGHSPCLYLIATNGKSLARCKLKKARNIDWEAMGSFLHGGKPWLMVADVGDNSLNRTDYRIYLLPEPELSQKKKKKKSRHKLESTVAKIGFAYDDGNHNVEAAAVSPDGKSIWFIEKIYTNDARPIQPGIYRLPLIDADFDGDSSEDANRETNQDANKNAGARVATRLANYPIRNVTGMAFSPDGRRLIVRNYLNAHVYTRPEGRTWEETVKQTKPTPVVLPIQSQGEAICFTVDSKSVLITSEFKRSTIWQVKLPTVPSVEP